MGKQVEKKRKKKGRPSLLDLQKRTLRLQKQHEQQQQHHNKRNPNPTTNPYARFPNPLSDRRPPRRNPSPVLGTPSPATNAGDTPASASDEEDDEPTERRKEKKIKLVVHLPHADANLSDDFASDSEAAGIRRREINAVGKEEGKCSMKASEDSQDLGPKTPLPDKNLLEFILDRLQKKDTYGVFSEPVEPDELPDYHDIIKHPMDFQTVRNKLSSGVYTNLEQFEKDVFLISSNAMRYNSADTIYFRQARSIHELAKKNFENLRQGSDDSEPEPKPKPEPEPKVVRRGRPPGTGKNNIKRSAGKLPAEPAPSEYSSETRLANSGSRNHIFNPWFDFLGKGTALIKPGAAVAAGVSSRTASGCAPSSEPFVLSSENKSAASEDCSGRYIFAVDENRRDTYKQYLPSSAPEFALRKNLVPVGFHTEHAYARSLARFAANLGPFAWKLASVKIKKALPPGTLFGPGWVGKSNAPQLSHHPPTLSAPSFHPSSALSGRSAASTGDESPEKQEELRLNECDEQDRLTARAYVTPNAAEPKAYSPFCQIPMMRPPSNGFKAPFVPGNFSRPNTF